MNKTNNKKMIEIILSCLSCIVENSLLSILSGSWYENTYDDQEIMNHMIRNETNKAVYDELLEIANPLQQLELRTKIEARFNEQNKNIEYNQDYFIIQKNEMLKVIEKNNGLLEAKQKINKPNKNIELNLIKIEEGVYKVEVKENKLKVSKEDFIYLDSYSDNSYNSNDDSISSDKYELITISEIVNEIENNKEKNELLIDIVNDTTMLVYQQEHENIINKTKTYEEIGKTFKIILKKNLVFSKYICKNNEEISEELSDRLTEKFLNEKTNQIYELYNKPVSKKRKLDISVELLKKINKATGLNNLDWHYLSKEKELNEIYTAAFNFLVNELPIEITKGKLKPYKEIEKMFKELVIKGISNIETDEYKVMYLTEIMMKNFEFQKEVYIEKMKNKINLEPNQYQITLIDNYIRDKSKMIFALNLEGPLYNIYLENLKEFAPILTNKKEINIKFLNIFEQELIKKIKNNEEMFNICEKNMEYVNKVAKLLRETFEKSQKKDFYKVSKKEIEEYWKNIDEVD